MIVRQYCLTIIYHSLSKAKYDLIFNKIGIVKNRNTVNIEILKGNIQKLA